MDPPRVGDDIREGTRALEAAGWAEARRAFEAALERGESAEASEGLGLALWFLGDVAAGISCRERAFATYQREDRVHDAARVAVWVSHQHAIGGRPSAARGWLARAERVLADAGDGPGHGWVAVERARHATAVTEQVAQARTAIEIARETREDDLLVFAMSLLGRAEVSAGRREPGLLLLEEAMAAATAGVVRNVHTLAEAYCNLIMACASVGEWERSAEWCEQVEEFARSHRTEPLYGACRSVHADVLLATGRWPEAELALEAALATHARYIPELGGPTVATLAELRILQGRLAEAERLLAGREENPTSLRALALLRIAEGRPRDARILLERGLRDTEGDIIRTTQLLAALVDACLAAGEVAAAHSAGQELAGHARDSGIRLATARAELAGARIAIATGRHGEAAEPARKALREFGALAMPLDAACARLELARALQHTAPDLAIDEARTALAALRELGASHPMDSAAALLREFGVGAAGRPRTVGALTAREQEVLGLVAHGMSNARIAATLCISEKTAGHHVSRILSKLGVHNRAEAAAHAARVGAAESESR